MSIRLAAVQHLCAMRGGSQAHLVRASDGAYYVIKFQNNPQHIKILANEMLATRLGRWLGLPMPPVEVIEVSEWLVAHSPELRIRLGAGALTPCSSGRQLGSRYAGGRSHTAVMDYLPGAALEQVENLRDFARVLVLDQWTANSDGRQAIFSRGARARGYRASFIDQGYCFNAGEWSYPDSPLRGLYGNPLVYREVTGWQDFEPALSRAEQAGADDLWACAQGLPEEWYAGDRSGLERLIESLYRRRLMLRDLITAVRNSSRSPFPKWNNGVA